MAVTHEAEPSVRALLERLLRAYSAERVEEALSRFSKDATFVGTGRDEIRFGLAKVRAQVERDLSRQRT